MNISGINIQKIMYPKERKSCQNDIEEGQKIRKASYEVIQHRVSSDTLEEIMKKTVSDEKRW